MATDKGILVGIDLADDYTQICCTGAGGDLTSVSLSKDPQKFRIPTVLGALSGSTEWLFGEEAAAVADTDTVVKIGNLLEL
nr:hypothetical protein [Lachnospiraceae bacterium]